MQRQSDLPLTDDLVDGRTLRRMNPRIGNARLTRRLLHFPVARIEEDAALARRNVRGTLRLRRLFHLVHVVENHAHVADAPDAGVGADRRQAVFQTRIAQDALLRLVRLPVVIDFLVRTGGHAVTPATADVLRDEDDAVLVALVDRARRTRGDAGGIQTVVAEARQILHEEIVKFQLDLLAELLQIVIIARRLAAREIVLPVRPPLDLHALLRDQGARARHGLMVLASRMDQRLVVVCPRLVVVIKLGLIGMVEELHEAHRLVRAGGERKLAVLDLPAALPLLLIFPILRVADARLRLDVVEVHVLRALAVRPDVLARDRASMAAEALVKVHDHRYLRFNPQANRPPSSCARRRRYRAGCPSGRSN